LWFVNQGRAPTVDAPRIDGCGCVIMQYRKPSASQPDSRKLMIDNDLKFFAAA
jgi:hypothetical protein